MRRTFADILKSNNVNIKKEYSRLYSMFFDSEESSYSIRELIDNCFNKLWLRDTCMSLDEFDKEFGFDFQEQPQNFSLDYLVSFMEYVYNLTTELVSSCSIRYKSKLQTIQQQIWRILDKIKYVNVEQDNFIIFVPEKPEAIYVAEVVSESLSNKILEYNHHSLQNNLEGKKEILLKIVDELEPQRADLSKLDSSLESNLFYAFNKFNIRHNNCNPKAKTKYVSQFALLSNEEKEELYDWAYNQSLIAFIKLENAGLNEKFKEIKNKIDNNIIE